MGRERIFVDKRRREREAEQVRRLVLCIRVELAFVGSNLDFCMQDY